MKCEICKEKLATEKTTLPFSSYLYDVCKGCCEDLNKHTEALQNRAAKEKDDRKCSVCGTIKENGLCMACWENEPY